MKVFASLVLCATIGLAGCKSMEGDPTPYDTLMYSSPVEVAGKSAGLKVSLLGLKDTRCPQNVICIQPGWVELRLKVKSQSDSVRVETVFHNDPNTDKPKLFKLGSDQYLLSIQRVLPLPTEGKRLNIEEYSIGFTVVAQ